MKRITTLLMAMFCMILAHAQVSKILTMTEAGTLSSVLTADEKTSITELTVLGPIDTRDFVCMRDQIKLLSILNLENAEIMAYNGSGGTYYGSEYRAHEIPQESFYRNSVLRSVVLPSTLQFIGREAFGDCSALKEEIVLPAGLKSIEPFAFYDCEKLSGNMIFPEGLKSIGTLAFGACKKLTGGIILPKSLTTLGDGAFRYCTGFNGSLVLSDSLTSIEQSTFNQCYGLKGVLTLPPNLTIIGDDAFSGCSGLTGELQFSSELQSIGSRAFYDCSGLKGILNLPSNLTIVDEYTFQNCTGLEGVVFSNNIKTIKNSAFRGCAGLKGNINFPEDIEVIEGYAFYGCTGITGALSFPEGIEEIGSSAFYDVTGVDNVKINGTTPLVLENRFIWEEVIFVPTGTKAAYESANYWKEHTIIEEEVNLTLDVKTPGTLVTLISEAGSSANLVTHLTLTGTINDADFTIMRKKMPLLFSLNLEGLKNTQLPEDAFTENKTLTYVVLPSVLDTIGAQAFNACKSLSFPLVFPDGLIHIASNAFSSCSGLFGEIEFPLSLASIGANAFNQCKNLSGDLKLPENLLSVGGSAFYYCKNISRLFIPESLQSIEYYAFNTMENIELVRCMSQAPPKIVESCFNGINMDECRLEVPMGSLDTFSIAEGWEDFMNIYEIETPAESAYIKMQVSKGGVASKDGLILTNGRVLAVAKDSSLTIHLESKDGYLLKSVMFNEVDYTNTVNENSFTTPSNNESGNLTVLFEKKSVVVTILTTGSDIHLKDNVIAGSDRTYDILAETGTLIESVKLNGTDVTNELKEGRMTLSNILENQTIVITPVGDISAKSTTLNANSDISAWTANGNLFVESMQTMVNLEVISLNGSVLTKLDYNAYSYILKAPETQAFIIRAKLEDGHYENIKLVN